MAVSGVPQQRTDSTASLSNARSDAVRRTSSDLGAVHVGHRYVGGSNSNRIAQPQQQANVDASLRRRAVPRAQVKGGIAGGVLGVGGGIFGGMVLGTLIAPGVGTIVGGIVGGLFGAGAVGALAAKIGGWLAGGSRQDKVDRGINHLMDTGKINQNEARQLKDMNQSQLRDLVKISQGQTGILNPDDRTDIRRSLLHIAAKRGLETARQVKADILNLPRPQNKSQISDAATAAGAMSTLEAHLDPPTVDPRFAGVRNNPNELRDYKAFMRQGIIAKSAQVGRTPNGQELTQIQNNALLRYNRRQEVANATRNDVFDGQNHPWLAQKFEQWVRNVNRSGIDFDAVNMIDNLTSKSGTEFTNGLNSVMTMLNDSNRRPNVDLSKIRTLNRSIQKSHDENSIRRQLVSISDEARGAFHNAAIAAFKQWMQTQPEIQ